jgi:hypothetical protein
MSSALASPRVSVFVYGLAAESQTSAFHASVEPGEESTMNCRGENGGRHSVCRRNHREMLWGLFMFEAWRRRYFRDDSWA